MNFNSKIISKKSNQIYGLQKKTEYYNIFIKNIEDSGTKLFKNYLIEVLANHLKDIEDLILIESENTGVKMKIK